jgi:thiol-disulfide isomerase/thioredoxin
MINISGVDELNNFIINGLNNNMTLLLYFGASWCGPCTLLKDKLNNNDTLNIMPKLHVGYLDIDDNKNDELVNIYDISSLPTQLFIKLNKNKVHIVSRIEGYDFTKLKIEYDKY